MDKTLLSVREPHTYEQLADVLDYDPDSGVLTWKVHRRYGVTAGTVAGSKHNAGYLSLEFQGVSYLAHRVAWCLYHKEWPSHFIDHEDLDKANNRIQNLRPATRAGNAQNYSLRADNTSGVKGVNWHKKQQKWTARIQAHGKRYSLGYFNSVEDAAAALKAARLELHKEYSNDGNKTTPSLRH